VLIDFYPDRAVVAVVAAVHDARELRPVISRIVLYPDGRIFAETANFRPAAI
jgi:energy-coupling factor transporter ATP-binding protein EcfA2